VIDASGHRIGVERTARGLTIRFRLPKATKLTLVLRGPVPSCATVRRMHVRGKRGLNHVRLQALNRRRHRLAPGTYLLSALPVGSIDRLPVRVLRNGKVVRAKRLSMATSCTRSIVLGAAGSSLAASRTKTRKAAPKLEARARQVGPQTGVRHPLVVGGILGASHVAAPSTPHLSGAGSSGTGLIVILLAVALALGIPVLFYFAARSGLAKAE
jgi:hypothetical protein